MKIVNPTSFKAAPLPGRLNFPKHSLTWIIKGTFDLKPNAPAVVAEKQTFPTGTEFYPDDEERRGSPRYESDFAWFKPRADLLLVGACYAPEGRQVPSCPATFRVGNKFKTLAVIGNRHWEKSWLNSKLTDPAPFTRMELRYENSFGGGKFPANPVGKGCSEESDAATGKHWPLPNIEDPEQPILSPRNQPFPAGFGPLGSNWNTRKAKLGTYKGAYPKTRWPWFPEDFDWTHFNAAPEDMQLDGYLRGDEPVGFENLHPTNARYESQLPGLRVRCFLNRLSGVVLGELRFEEMEMKLDTLWVDMEAEKLVLVWRGWAPVENEDCEEILEAFVMSEGLTQTPATVEECHRTFLLLKAAAEKPFEPEAPPASAPDDQAVEAAEKVAAPGAARLKAREEMKSALTAQLAAVNAQLDLAGLSPQRQAELDMFQARLIDRMTENDPAKQAGLLYEEQRGELRAALAKMDLDLDNLPPLTAKAQAEHARLFSELGLSGAEVGTDRALAEMSGILNAVLGKAGMDPENFESLVAEAKKRRKQFAADTPQGETPEAQAQEKTAVPWTRELVEARHAERESLEGADLRGLDLSGLDLTGADLSSANLAEALLRNAKLRQANLTKANLAGADLTGADLATANAAMADFVGAKLGEATLKEADLTRANLANADLTGAVLDGGVFEAACLSRAVLVGSSAVGALFARADLSGVTCQKGVCVKADFTGASLQQADFRSADLSEASFKEVQGQGLDLRGAVLTRLRASGGDLTNANLAECKGNGSIWKSANLTGADMRFALLEDTLFTSACLRQANLSAADLKHGRLNKADLTDAKLIRMNLFQGNLERADLTRTNLSGSNLYEVEFLDAVLNGTLTEGANLKMTKLDAQ